MATTVQSTDLTYRRAIGKLVLGPGRWAARDVKKPDSNKVAIALKVIATVVLYLFMIAVLVLGIWSVVSVVSGKGLPGSTIETAAPAALTPALDPNAPLAPVIGGTKIISGSVQMRQIQLQDHTTGQPVQLAEYTVNGHVERFGFLTSVEGTITVVRADGSTQEVANGAHFTSSMGEHMGLIMFEPKGVDAMGVTGGHIVWFYIP